MVMDGASEPRGAKGALLRPPRSPLKRAANWSRNINHAFFQRELSCHSPARMRPSALSPVSTPRGPHSTRRRGARAVGLLRASGEHLSPRCSPSLISAFVFSHRTAKRDGEREGGKLSSASADSSLGQRGNAYESLSILSEAPCTRISPRI